MEMKGEWGERPRESVTVMSREGMSQNTRKAAGVSAGTGKR